MHAETRVPICTDVRIILQKDIGAATGGTRSDPTPLALVCHVSRLVSPWEA